jgi:hypothetical protein
LEYPTFRRHFHKLCDTEPERNGRPNKHFGRLEKRRDLSRLQIVQAADALGLPPEKVTVQLGDTRLPASHAAIGSSTMANAGASVLLAAKAARDKAVALALNGCDAPFAGAEAKDVVSIDGRLALARTSLSVSYAELLGALLFVAVAVLLGRIFQGAIANIIDTIADIGKLASLSSSPCLACIFWISSGGLSRPFLFQGDRYCRVRRQTHRLSFDIRDQPQVYKMMMTFVASFAAVGLRELDLTVFNAVDSSDMDAVCPDHFHMFFMRLPLISSLLTLVVEAMKVVGVRSGL